MTDVTLDRYLIWGTASDRAAFTPDPGVGTTGTNILPIWQDSDVAGNPAWTWDTATSAWIPFLAAGSSSRQLWQYKAKTTTTSGYPGDGFMLWNNATQTSATDLLFSHITSDGLDIDLFLALLASGDTVIVQDSTASADYQEWTISGAPVNTNPGLANSYWTLPVTLVGSGGTGTTNFSNNERLIAVIYAASGASAITALTGDVTATGPGSAAATIANNAVTTGKINNSAVTLAKIANAAANSKLLGSGASGSGSAYVELTLGTNLSMSGTTLNATGGGGSPGGSSGDIQYNNAGSFGGLPTSGVGAVQLITEVVTSGSQANVTFSSIPATYRDLIVQVRGRCDASGVNNQDLVVQLNGDTGTNYVRQYLDAFTSGVSAGSSSGNVNAYIGQVPAATATANYVGASEVTILDYRGTTFYKVMRSIAFGPRNSSQMDIQYEGNIWLSTAAVNAVKVFFASGIGNFVNGSVVSLYGRY